MNHSYRDRIKPISLVTSRTFQEEGPKLAARSYMGAVTGLLGGRSSSGAAAGQQGDAGQVPEAPGASASSSIKWGHTEYIASRLPRVSVFPT